MSSRRTSQQGLASDTKDMKDLASAQVSVHLSTGETLSCSFDYPIDSFEGVTVTLPVTAKGTKFSGKQYYDEGGTKINQYYIKKNDLPGPKPSTAIKIFVETIYEDEGILALDVEPSDTLGSLKVKINVQKGITCQGQCLFLGWKPLDDVGRTLAEYGIEDGTTLTLEIDPDEFLRYAANK